MRQINVILQTTEGNSGVSDHKIGLFLAIDLQPR